MAGDEITLRGLASAAHSLLVSEAPLRGLEVSCRA
jgi:hypothetical protein